MLYAKKINKKKLILNVKFIKVFLFSFHFQQPLHILQIQNHHNIFFHVDLLYVKSSFLHSLTLFTIYSTSKKFISPLHGRPTLQPYTFANCCVYSRLHVASLFSYVISGTVYLNKFFII